MRREPSRSHRDIDLDSDDGVRGALAASSSATTSWSATPRARTRCSPSAADQHLAAAFYRNTVIHFFLHGALAQAALARAERRGVEDPLATFWDAVLAGRDLLKFEFFFEPREEFCAAVAAELAVPGPDWEQRVAIGADGGPRACSRTCGR